MLVGGSSLVTEDVGLPNWPSKGNRRKLDQQWLEVLERNGLAAFLAGPIEAPAQLHKAIEEFNGELFWDCHETLEAVWLGTPYPLRLFHHAIIKVAVGLYHANRHNRRGARVKLSEGVRLLRVFRPVFMGVDTDALCRDASEWVERLERDGPIDWGRLDAIPIPRIDRE